MFTIMNLGHKKLSETTHWSLIYHVLRPRISAVFASSTCFKPNVITDLNVPKKDLVLSELPCHIGLVSLLILRTTSVHSCSQYYSCPTVTVHWTIFCFVLIWLRCTSNKTNIYAPRPLLLPSLSLSSWFLRKDWKVTPTQATRTSKYGFASASLSVSLSGTTLQGS